jgi:hypothetical protein
MGLEVIPLKKLSLILVFFAVSSTFASISVDGGLLASPGANLILSAGYTSTLHWVFAMNFSLNYAYGYHEVKGKADVKHHLIIPAVEVMFYPVAPMVGFKCVGPYWNFGFGYTHDWIRADIDGDGVRHLTDNGVSIKFAFGYDLRPQYPRIYFEVGRQVLVWVEEGEYSMWLVKGGVRF